MTGMNAQTGAAFDSELDHIRQSIRDILTTPLGSRVMRRDYGSAIPDLIDYPGNDIGRLRLQAASIGAISRWEPRVSITALRFDYDFEGKVVCDIDLIRVGGPRSGAAASLSIGLS